jgi:glycerophosphoryl diester phosphodiesterase
MRVTSSGRSPSARRTLGLAPVMVALMVALGLLASAVSTPEAQYTSKTNIAHRGASAYAPEHTAAAYRLALEQGADYVEQDLQITKDGVLVCLHDMTLERTTNVAEVFPDRFRTERFRKTWPVADFTLAEVKRLDAGSWFDRRFAGERVLTLQESIDLVRGKAGIFPETKAPEVYGRLGFDVERLVLDELERNGLDTPGADPHTPVVIQSFSPESLQKTREMGTRLALVLLISDGDRARGQWLSDEGLAKAGAFADGIGPAKSLVLADPTLVTRAHKLGLSVTPYTFRSAGLPTGQTVREEMEKFLYELGVDAVFTDNPDQFPRR